MKKVLACLATGTALLSVPAMAQTAEGSFTGPRVEAIVGYDITKAGSDVDDDFNDRNDQSIDGLLYGGGIGYDYDFGRAVVGVEGEVTGSTAKTSFNDDGDFEGFGLGNVKTKRDFYVGARAGIKATPNTLVYVKGGYTNARFGARASDGTNISRLNFDADGWRLGAGVEQKFGTNTFAKLEYRYSNYSKAELDFRDDIPDSDRFNVDLDRHQVVASVGYRF
ncbi:outer membrane immunogenic protein [Novosphingobium fluoreni]|uniref:Outer membrane immunogenic protein n=1 Tax=Novosphingobium fluoreni TaxID=1391222 RepID=A0A7W6FZB4_9SPHN|nr:outer membrane beta-barrel protein [Novosphingobium fluoreni]MBB3940935.1 outer membrane immunogenic protein [Novosphingobium fluoreni]